MLTFGPPVFAALFAEEELQRTKTDHLDAIGIARFAAQKHPQGRGSLCRTHYYYLPGQLEARLAEFIDFYNDWRYHESLGNLTPADIYFRRGSTILARRQNIKHQTIELRRRFHQRAVA